MKKYKVALPGGRWKYGFETIQAATEFHGRRYRRTGIIAAIEEYKTRGKS